MDCLTISTCFVDDQHALKSIEQCLIYSVVIVSIINMKT